MEVIDNLRLIVLNNAKDLGEKVNYCLQKKRNTNQNFIVPITQVRFNNGEGKIQIDETIREKDVYVISDVGNYECSYQMHGRTIYMGPDEHFQDIKRIISAMKGHGKSISVVMPLLYASRQHRRKGRESLDCAVALQELETLGVKSIITFDAHDPNVQNAIPCMAFENFYPTYSILEKLVTDQNITIDNIKDWLIIGPDSGAIDRARYVASALNKAYVGVFYKSRSYDVKDGMNPIEYHEYIGKSVKGRNALVVDDMIASGGSIIEVVNELKQRGADKVCLLATFSLLTSGIEKFDKLYEEKKFNALYTTNLTYVDNEAINRPWFHQVDCSEYLATIIDTLNKQESIAELINRKENILVKTKKK